MVDFKNWTIAVDGRRGRDDAIGKDIDGSILDAPGSDERSRIPWTLAQWGT